MAFDQYHGIFLSRVAVLIRIMEEIEFFTRFSVEHNILE